MIEIPEARVLSCQLETLLINKRIVNIIAGKTPHKFAWFYQDPKDYPNFINSEVIMDVKSYGGIIELETLNCRIILAEGVHLQYFSKDDLLPNKHQLAIEFDDKSTLICTVRMYGGLWAFPKGKVIDLSNWLQNYLENAMNKPNPLSEDFTFNYFKSLMDTVGNNESLKATLATKGRIPGLGNGVLHDILFSAKLHPKCKKSTLSTNDYQNLYIAIKETLKQMVEARGRDNETDLSNIKGGYKTLSSSSHCQVCHTPISKEQYLRGSIYYCPSCQKV